MSDTVKDVLAGTWKELRDELDRKLKLCTPGQQDMFRRMYNHLGMFERDVDAISNDRLSRAFDQVERTLVKNARPTPSSESKPSSQERK